MVSAVRAGTSATQDLYQQLLAYGDPRLTDLVLRALQARRANGLAPLTASTSTSQPSSGSPDTGLLPLPAALRQAYAGDDAGSAAPGSRSAADAIAQSIVFAPPARPAGTSSMGDPSAAMPMNDAPSAPRSDAQQSAVDRSALDSRALGRIAHDLHQAGRVTGNDAMNDLGSVVNFGRSLYGDMNNPNGRGVSVNTIGSGINALGQLTDNPALQKVGHAAVGAADAVKALNKGDTVGAVASVGGMVSDLTGNKAIGGAAQVAGGIKGLVTANGNAGSAIGAGSAVVSGVGSLIGGKTGQTLGTVSGIGSNVAAAVANKVPGGAAAPIVGAVQGLVGLITKDPKVNAGVGVAGGIATAALATGPLGVVAGVAGAVLSALGLFKSQKGQMGDHGQDTFADLNADGIFDKVQRDNDNDITSFLGRQDKVAIELSEATLGTTWDRGNVLWANQLLGPGQSMTSANGRFQAKMQEDGNFVVFDKQVAAGEQPKPVWQSNTGGFNASVLTLGGDGVLATYRPSPEQGKFFAAWSGGAPPTPPKPAAPIALPGLSAEESARSRGLGGRGAPQVALPGGAASGAPGSANANGRVWVMASGPNAGAVVSNLPPPDTKLVDGAVQKVSRYEGAGRAGLRETQYEVKVAPVPAPPPPPPAGFFMTLQDDGHLVVSRGAGPAANGGAVWSSADSAGQIVLPAFDGKLQKINQRGLFDRPSQRVEMEVKDFDGDGRADLRWKGNVRLNDSSGRFGPEMPLAQAEAAAAKRAQERAAAAPAPGTAPAATPAASLGVATAQPGPAAPRDDVVATPYVNPTLTAGRTDAPRAMPAAPAAVNVSTTTAPPGLLQGSAQAVPAGAAAGDAFADASTFGVSKVPAAVSNTPAPVQWSLNNQAQIRPLGALDAAAVDRTDTRLNKAVIGGQIGIAKAPRLGAADGSGGLVWRPSSSVRLKTSGGDVRPSFDVSNASYAGGTVGLSNNANYILRGDPYGPVLSLDQRTSRRIREPNLSTVKDTPTQFKGLYDRGTDTNTWLKLRPLKPQQQGAGRVEELRVPLPPNPEQLRSDAGAGTVRGSTLPVAAVDPRNQSLANLRGVYDQTQGVVSDAGSNLPGATTGDPLAGLFDGKTVTLPNGRVVGGSTIGNPQGPVKDFRFGAERPTDIPTAPRGGNYGQPRSQFEPDPSADQWGGANNDVTPADLGYPAPPPLPPDVQKLSSGQFKELSVPGNGKTQIVDTFLGRTVFLPNGNKRTYAPGTSYASIKRDLAPAVAKLTVDGKTFPVKHVDKLWSAEVNGKTVFGASAEQLHQRIIERKNQPQLGKVSFSFDTPSSTTAARSAFSPGPSSGSVFDRNSNLFQPTDKPSAPSIDSGGGKVDSQFLFGNGMPTTEPIRSPITYVRSGGLFNSPVPVLTPAAGGNAPNESWGEQFRKTVDFYAKPVQDGAGTLANWFNPKEARQQRALIDQRQHADLLDKPNTVAQMQNAVVEAYRAGKIGPNEYRSRLTTLSNVHAAALANVPPDKLGPPAPTFVESMATTLGGGDPLRTALARDSLIRLGFDPNKRPDQAGVPRVEAPVNQDGPSRLERSTSVQIPLGTAGQPKPWGEVVRSGGAMGFEPTARGAEQAFSMARAYAGDTGVIPPAPDNAPQEFKARFNQLRNEHALAALANAAQNLADGAVALRGGGARRPSMDERVADLQNQRLPVLMPRGSADPGTVQLRTGPDGVLLPDFGARETGAYPTGSRYQKGQPLARTSGSRSAGGETPPFNSPPDATSYRTPDFTIRRVPTDAAGPQRGRDAPSPSDQLFGAGGLSGSNTGMNLGGTPEGPGAGNAGGTDTPSARKPAYLRHFTGEAPREIEISTLNPDSFKVARRQVDPSSTERINGLVSPREITQLLGGLGDARVTVSTNLLGDEPNQPQVITVTHPVVSPLQFDVRPNDKGDGRVLNIVELAIDAGANAAPRLGTAVVLKLIDNARRLGFDEVTFTAAGGPNSPKNGHRAWPHIGADGAVRPDVVTRFNDFLRAQPEVLAALGRPADFRFDPNGTRVLDILFTPDGKPIAKAFQFWKDNGHAYNARFDLKNSDPRSAQILNRALAQLQIGGDATGGTSTNSALDPYAGNARERDLGPPASGNPLLDDPDFSIARQGGVSGRSDRPIAFVSDEPGSGNTGGVPPPDPYFDNRIDMLGFVAEGNPTRPNPIEQMSDRDLRRMRTDARKLDRPFSDGSAPGARVFGSPPFSTADFGLMGQAQVSAKPYQMSRSLQALVGPTNARTSVSLSFADAGTGERLTQGLQQNQVYAGGQDRFERVNASRIAPAGHDLQHLAGFTGVDTAPLSGGTFRPNGMVDEASNEALWRVLRQTPEFKAIEADLGRTPGVRALDVAGTNETLGAANNVLLTRDDVDQVARLRPTDDGPGIGEVVVSQAGDRAAFKANRRLDAALENEYRSLFERSPELARYLSSNYVTALGLVDQAAGQYAKPVARRIVTLGDAPGAVDPPAQQATFVLPPDATRALLEAQRNAYAQFPNIPGVVDRLQAVQALLDEGRRRATGRATAEPTGAPPNPPSFDPGRRDDTVPRGVPLLRDWQELKLNRGNPPVGFVSQQPPGDGGRRSVPDRPVPPRPIDRAAGGVARTLGQNVNPTLRDLGRQLGDGSLRMDRFDAGADAQTLQQQVTQALRGAGVQRSEPGAEPVIALARELDVDAVQLARQLATRAVQDQTAVRGTNSRNPLAVDEQRGPQSLQQGTELLTRLLAQATPVPARTMTVEADRAYEISVPEGVAQTEVKTDLDGVFAVSYGSKGLQVPVIQRDGSTANVYLPLGDQALPGKPTRLFVLNNADLAVVEVEVRSDNQQRTEGFAVPITPEQKALMQSGVISGVQYVEGLSARLFPPESIEFLREVSDRNVYSGGGELPGRVRLPRVEPNTFGTMGKVAFQVPAELVTSVARSLPLRDVQYDPANPGQTRPGLFSLPGITVYSGGSAKTVQGISEPFGLSAPQQQAMQSVADRIPSIVQNLSARYDLSDEAREAWMQAIFANPDIPSVIIPGQVVSEFGNRNEPGQRLRDLQADIERELVALVQRYGMDEFVQLHHTPTGRSATSNDAVAFAPTPEERDRAIAQARASGREYKPPEVTTEWQFAVHSQKGMAVLDGVIAKLSELHGVDLKAELEQAGHTYGAIRTMLKDEFVGFLRDTVRPMIEAHGIDLGQVIVPVDTYEEKGGRLDGSDLSMIAAAAALYGAQNTRVVQVDTFGGQPPAEEGRNPRFTLGVDARGQLSVNQPAVDPDGPNADLAPTLYVTRPVELGRMMRDAYRAQLPLAPGEIDAIRNRPDGGPDAPGRSAGSPPGTPPMAMPSVTDDGPEGIANESRRVELKIPGDDPSRSATLALDDQRPGRATVTVPDDVRGESAAALIRQALQLADRRGQTWAVVNGTDLNLRSAAVRAEAGLPPLNDKRRVEVDIPGDVESRAVTLTLNDTRPGQASVTLPADLTLRSRAQFMPELFRQADRQGQHSLIIDGTVHSLESAKTRMSMGLPLTRGRFQVLESTPGSGQYNTVSILRAVETERGVPLTPFEREALRARMENGYTFSFNEQGWLPTATVTLSPGAGPLDDASLTIEHGTDLVHVAQLLDRAMEQARSRGMARVRLPDASVADPAKWTPLAARLPVTVQGPPEPPRKASDFATDFERAYNAAQARDEAGLPPPNVFDSDSDPEGIRSGTAGEATPPAALRARLDESLRTLDPQQREAYDALVVRGDDRDSLMNDLGIDRTQLDAIEAGMLRKLGVDSLREAIDQAIDADDGVDFRPEPSTTTLSANDVMAELRNIDRLTPRQREVLAAWIDSGTDLGGASERLGGMGKRNITSVLSQIAQRLDDGNVRDLRQRIKSLQGDILTAPRENMNPALLDTFRRVQTVPEVSASRLSPNELETLAAFIEAGGRRSQAAALRGQQPTSYDRTLYRMMSKLGIQGPDAIGQLNEFARSRRLLSMPGSDLDSPARRPLKQPTVELPTEMRQAFERFRDDPRIVDGALSAREITVLAAWSRADGDRQQAASVLGMTPGLVASHLSHVTRRLGLEGDDSLHALRQLAHEVDGMPPAPYRSQRDLSEPARPVFAALRQRAEVQQGGLGAQELHALSEAAARGFDVDGTAAALRLDGNATRQLVNRAARLLGFDGAADPALQRFVADASPATVPAAVDPSSWQRRDGPRSSDEVLTSPPFTDIALNQQDLRSLKAWIDSSFDLDAAQQALRLPRGKKTLNQHLTKVTDSLGVSRDQLRELVARLQAGPATLDDLLQAAVDGRRTWGRDVDGIVGMTRSGSGMSTPDGPQPPSTPPSAPARRPLGDLVAVPIAATSGATRRAFGAVWNALDAPLRNDAAKAAVTRASNFDPFAGIDRAVNRALQAPLDLVTDLLAGMRQKRYTRKELVQDQEFKSAIAAREKIVERWARIDTTLQDADGELARLQGNVQRLLDRVSQLADRPGTQGMQRSLMQQVQETLDLAPHAYSQAVNASQELGRLAGRYARHADEQLDGLRSTLAYREQQLQQALQRSGGVPDARVRAAEAAVGKARSALDQAQFAGTDPFRDSIVETIDTSRPGSVSSVRRMPSLATQADSFRTLKLASDAVRTLQPLRGDPRATGDGSGPAAPLQYLQDMRDALSALKDLVATRRAQAEETIDALQEVRLENATSGRAATDATIARSDLSREVGLIGGLRSVSKRLAGKDAKYPANSGKIVAAQAQLGHDMAALAHLHLGPQWESRISDRTRRLIADLRSDAPDPRSRVGETVRSLERDADAAGESAAVDPRRQDELLQAVMDSARRLDLEQRAAAPLKIAGIAGRIAHNVERSAAILEDATRKKESIEREIDSQVGAIESQMRGLEASMADLRSQGQDVPPLLQQVLQERAGERAALLDRRSTNQMALERMQSMHRTHTEKLAGVQAAYERAVRLQGATPGKLLRVGAGLMGNLGRAATLHTLAGVPLGWTGVETGDRAAQTAIRHLNLPPQTSSLGTSALVLKTPYQHLYAAAQGPGVRGPIATALPQLFGVKAGTATPTAFLGSKGQLQAVFTSDRAQLAGIALGSSFHPLGENAISLQNIWELRAMPFGGALRTNPRSDFTKGGERFGIEIMGNTPASPRGVPWWIPGVQYQQSNRVGLGKITFGADFAGYAPGRSTTRDIPFAIRFDPMRLPEALRSGWQGTKGQQPFGSGSTASEIGKNYQYVPGKQNNVFEQIATAASEPLAQGFEALGKVGDVPGWLVDGLRRQALDLLQGTPPAGPAPGTGPTATPTPIDRPADPPRIDESSERPGTPPSAGGGARSNLSVSPPFDPADPAHAAGHPLGRFVDPQLLARVENRGDVQFVSSQPPGERPFDESRPDDGALPPRNVETDAQGRVVLPDTLSADEARRYAERQPGNFEFTHRAADGSEQVLRGGMPVDPAGKIGQGFGLRSRVAEVEASSDTTGSAPGAQLLTYVAPDGVPQGRQLLERMEQLERQYGVRFELTEGNVVMHGVHGQQRELLSRGGDAQLRFAFAGEMGTVTDEANAPRSLIDALRRGLDAAETDLRIDEARAAERRHAAEGLEQIGGLRNSVVGDVLRVPAVGEAFARLEAAGHTLRVRDGALVMTRPGSDRPETVLSALQVMQAAEQRARFGGDDEIGRAASVALTFAGAVLDGLRSREYGAAWQSAQSRLGEDRPQGRAVLRELLRDDPEALRALDALWSTPGTDMEVAPNGLVFWSGKELSGAERNAYLSIAMGTRPRPLGETRVDELKANLALLAQSVASAVGVDAIAALPGNVMAEAVSNPVVRRSLDELAGRGYRIELDRGRLLATPPTTDAGTTLTTAHDLLAAAEDAALYGPREAIGYLGSRIRSAADRLLASADDGNATGGASGPRGTTIGVDPGAAADGLAADPRSAVFSAEQRRQMERGERQFVGTGFGDGEPEPGSPQDQARLRVQARILFREGGFDVSTASAQQTYDLLVQAAGEFNQLRAAAHAIRAQRPELMQPTIVEGGREIANPAAAALQSIFDREAERTIPPALAQARETRLTERFYDATADQPPSPWLREGLETYVVLNGRPPQSVVDIGSGAGVESQYLLEQGARVIAVDPQPGAARRLAERVQSLPEEQRGRLTQIEDSFERARLPANVDVVWAGRTLPHIEPRALPAVMDKIAATLRPGGLFVANFFGPEHPLAGTLGMSFLNAEQVRRLVPADWEIVALQSDGERRSQLIARKPAAAVDDAGERSRAEAAPTEAPTARSGPRASSVDLAGAPGNRLLDVVRRLQRSAADERRDAR